jgi:hypothetical protein
LNALRNQIEDQRVGYLDVELKLPYVNTAVHLQLRCSDAYIIGFRGQDGWYHFDGEDGGWGKNCGIVSSYTGLPDVGQITVGKVDNLASLANFRSGGALDGRLVVIAAAVVSESLRFATVATYFTGLFNGMYKEFQLNQVVPSGDLKRKYFLNWADLTQKNDPGVLLRK